MSFITFNESNKPSGFPFYEMKAEILTAVCLQPTFEQSKALQVRENVCVLDLKTCPFKKGILHFYTIYNGDRASNQPDH